MRTIKRILSRNTPRKSAKLFRDQARPNIISQQDEWLDWNSHCYVTVEEATLDSEIAEWLDASYEQTINHETGKPRTTPFSPKPRDVWAVRDSLKKMVHKPADKMSPPCWLDGGKGHPKPRDLISVENGLLDIATGERIDATPLFFNRTSLPIVYDPNAPQPELWIKFLREVTAKRVPLMALLQEIFGYIVSGDTSQQVVPHFWGVTRGGKGTTLRVLNELVGTDNVCSPSLQELAGDFGLQTCLGMSLIQVTDMDTEEKVKLNSAVSRILAISGEDHVSVQRKTLTSWKGHLPGRIVIVSSNLPDFGSHVTALAARLLVVPYEVSFLGREDKKLTEKLLTELPGILNWSLRGLRRLRERGCFDEPEQSKAAKLRMLHYSEPVRGFVEERCTLDSTEGIGTDKDVLYPRYRTYCKTIGVAPLSQPKFLERLYSLYRSVAASKRSAADGSRPPIVAGLRFNDQEAARVYNVDRIAIEDFGATGYDAVERDETGWPIPKMEAASDFD
jgi:putative DNA primase/helicase